MSSEFDEFVNKLRKKIEEEEKKVFSETLRREYNNPSNLGKLEDYDGFARVQSDCGDSMLIYIRIGKKDGNKEIIDRIKFRVAGCGVTTAVGSMLTKMVKGKSLEEARSLTPEDVERALGGLPDDKKHCAVLGVDTLRAAIDDYLKKRP